MNGLSPQQVKELLYLQLPNARARAGWLIDREAVKEAIKLLDITLPVKISYQKYKVRDGGAHQRGVHRIRNGVHDIRLADTLTFTDRETRQSITAEVLNRTLWHELAHCMQAERFARNRYPNYSLATAVNYFNSEYRKARGVHGSSYEGNYYEIEANQVAVSKQYTRLIKA
jgi:hypothetical protein